MAEATNELVVMITAQHRSRAFFSRVHDRQRRHNRRHESLRVFSSAGVDLVRKRATDTTEVKPLEPLATLIRAFIERGGTLWACTPCVKARGYTQEDLVEGTVITGASVMLDRLKAGAASLTF